MAYDPDWNDKQFPTLDEIYRKGNIIEFNQRTKNTVLKPLIQMIDTIIKSKNFKNYVFDDSVIDVNSKSFAGIISLMKQCSIELLENMLLKVLGGVVDKEVLGDLAGACLSLSIKLYGAHDWIYSGDVLKGIFYKARDEGVKLDLKLMNIMERDIMKNTDWKGCATFYLNKTYDPMFKDGDFDISESEYREMSKKGSSMIKSRVGNIENAIGNAELTYGEFGGGPLGFYLEYKGSYYSSLDDIPITEKDINIVVYESLVDIISKKKNLTKEETMKWLKDRVLKVGFNINPLSLEYKSSYRMVKHKSRRVSRKASRKSSRKSRKASRKSRKASRKSRKSRKASRKSRKSRKASRKSRKASRKSRKASRKLRKASRKSRKASRKSRKASRKSSRKSRKASRKSRKSRKASRKSRKMRKMKKSRNSRNASRK